MESGNNHASHENIWHQQQQLAAGDQSKQFYMNHYQPMQHGFDLQREIASQPSPPNAAATTTPDNVHFLRDNNGPYVKIYYSDTNKEYELFERGQMQHQQQQQPQDNPMFMNNVDMFNNYLPNTQMPFQPPPPPPPQLINHHHHHHQHPQQQQQPQQQKSNNNSVIHHLVTSNLGPGKFEFGTFGGHLNNNNNSNSSAYPAPTTAVPLNISIPVLLEHASSVQSASYNSNNMENGASNVSEVSPLQPQSHMTSSVSAKNSAAPSPPATASTSYINSSSSNNKKQRIVAEVKPYKLSYSDVVSKNGSSGQVPVSSGHSNSNSSSPNTTMPVSSGSKANKAKYQASTAVTGSNGSFEKKFPENGSGGDKNRKSPTSPVVNNAVNSEIKRAQPTAVRVDKPSSPPTTQNSSNSSQCFKKKKPQTKDSLNVKSSSSSSSSPLSSSANRSEVPKNKCATDSEDQSSAIDSENDEEEIEDEEEDASEFYDIHKNVFSGEHHKVEKIKSYKKSKQQGGAMATSMSKKSERSQKRMSSKPVNRKQKNKFLEKLIASCIEYLYIFGFGFGKWLWNLIYDVSYLSMGIIWDRMSLGYQYAMQGVSYVRRELKGNPGMAFIAWIKNMWKKFDSKFDKKSKWAFWRWMFKKQLSGEHAKDYFKDGKLPKTAEEAMKSLLNCKEKDAYSILGVSPDCPQEQIKKHYKKIAVLVHPDKNKQAGAEEAFKVLQRSFELIGEPESRKQYNENLAKALHTEKAFNELNDLLIQLQTKISEAANTIRCSSCCFRHPRKPTGRKPFAARNCSTCKIRHAAREGDIWAETTFFGLRWKYLALMEGNVYDITEWALCQRGALSHLQANSCVVQYKIVLGGNQQNQNQAAAGGGGGGGGGTGDRDRFNKKDAPAHEPQEDFFLNNIYAGQGPQQQQQQQTTRRRFKKN